MADDVVTHANELLRGPIPRALVLSNGGIATLVSESGGGRIQRGRLAVTRWAPDRTRDADGIWLYVKDLDSGAWWRAAPQPGASVGAVRQTAFRPGVVTLEREDDGVLTRVEVCVAPDADAELRRITLVNSTDRARRLQLTTYAELVLNTPAADEGHPAFSKLFVQTAYRRDAGALVAWRRLRSPDDEPLWAAHLLVSESGIVRDADFETDRMRFIGRGRTVAYPRMMDAGATPSGSVGNVLDPVFSLRHTIELPPHGTVSLASVIAAAPDAAAVDVAVRFGSLDGIAAAFAVAERTAVALSRPVDVAEWERLPSTIGAMVYAERGAASVATELLASAPESMLERVAARARAHVVPPEAGRGLEPPAAPSEVIPAAMRLSSGVVQGGAADGAGPRESLRFWNGHGGFGADGAEYVIHVPGTDGERLPPLPWSNVVANQSAGFIVSETGAGYTWSINSRENRLTPWMNDPVSDPPGEALYLRDESTGEFWSPTPAPSPDGVPYEVRHGLGYSRFGHTHGTLESDLWMFVPRHDDVKVVRVLVTNQGDAPRRLAAYHYGQWVLGTTAHAGAPLIHTSLPDDRVSVASNPERGEFASRVAFAAVGAPRGVDVSRTCDRAEFLGCHGDPAAPAAVVRGGSLGERAGSGFDPCAATRVTFDLAPGETTEIVFLLGEAEGERAALELARRYRDVSVAARALEEVRAFWRELTEGIRIETPDATLDLMVNHWLPYQNLSCRMWGRSAFYQSGGAFGFRDQLQDSSALLYLDPQITRRQILLHAGHQFAEGDVLHWWHPPLGKGMRTRFSDDLLWLPYITAFYLRSTGDEAVLDDHAAFLRGRELAPGEDEVFLLPEESGVTASVYEHCCRAIDRSLTRGAHGLPLMGVGDWNDGMNRVGREGRGESVWLGFFLYEILGDFIPIAERRGDLAHCARWRAYREELGRALDADGKGWDGRWYRRAYYDDGTPLGSSGSDECRIDVIAQAWAVLSGAARPEHATVALDEMEKRLVSEREGIIRLLTPAFDRTPHDPGYIKGYLPGVRENGGQYTHGALWAVRAEAMMGRRERAARLLSMLSPVSHGRTADEVAAYQAEPYVIAADVYGVEPHVGRAGWTWYTGSAGWMYRVALESVLGFELRDGKTIELRPCAPFDWPGFVIRYRLPDAHPGGGARTSYELRVQRAVAGAATTARGASGEQVVVADGAVRIPLAHDGAVHRIEISLGEDVGPRYEQRRAV
jgi:N,N'-diacetylchitobiose phosphorylase